VTSSAESPSTETPTTWSVVETEEDLAAWAVVHGAGDTFRGELVRDPSVRVLAAHGPTDSLRGRSPTARRPVWA
jgi:hypothetical protein